MANPQSNLDELMKDPKAAGLLKNKALLQSLMQSPDTQRLMELLSQNAGDGLKTAAAKGDTGALLGMVTDRDIILRCVAAGEDPSHVPVRTIMTRHPAAVSPDADPRQAARLMSGQQIRRLPVVDNGKVVGMLSLGDLAKCGRWEMEISRALTDISENIRHP